MRIIEKNSWKWIHGPAIRLMQFVLVMAGAGALCLLFIPLWIVALIQVMIAFAFLRRKDASQS